MPARHRFSIPTRVFLGFVAVLTVSGGVLVTSILQHQRTAATLRLLHEGYLPLALTVGEVRATQAVFSTLLDRVLSERDPAATRNWLNAARRVRPATLRKALDGIAQTQALEPSQAQRAALERLEEALLRVRDEYAEGDATLDAFFRALSVQDKETAAALLADLRSREHTIDKRLRGVWTAIQAQIAESSAAASTQEAQSLLVLAGLAGLAMLIGMIVMVWAQRMLSPLPRLQKRVEAVARGDLARQLGPTRDDEIGHLAREFERMVSALAARDDSLREATERLIQSERLAAIGRMAAHVTHEVRNPLNSLRLNVELLEEDLEAAQRADGGQDAGAEARLLLKDIQREIERLTSITEEYLRVARLPNPQLELEDLGDLVEMVGRFMEPELNAASIRLELQVEPGLPLVALDESQVRQALLNMLRNAREAMFEGGCIRLIVSRAAANDSRGEGVVVQVRDEGAGMDPTSLARIFDMYYTTKKHGTGLGLPLTQQIMVAHGGQIQCDSALGQGTTFELWFPLAEASTQRAAAFAS